MYAIINKRTKKFVCGTDFRRMPFKQITSNDKMLTYDDIELAKCDFRHRRCGKDYRLVKVEVKVCETNNTNKM